MLLWRAKNREEHRYGITDGLLYKCLDKYDISNMSIAVIGTVVPFYECICLSCGARPLTIEYRKIISGNPLIRTTTVDEYWKAPEICDCAMSISSLEHDGLGRYGDCLDADGDIKSMQNIKKIVKKDGLLFLSIPIGKEDKLVWNAHRIYGDIRLPLLLEGWKLIDEFVFTKNDLLRVTCDWGQQPIFVLKNEGGPKL